MITHVCDPSLYRAPSSASLCPRAQGMISSCLKTAGHCGDGNVLSFFRAYDTLTRVSYSQLVFDRVREVTIVGSVCGCDCSGVV